MPQKAGSATKFSLVSWHAELCREKTLVTSSHSTLKNPCSNPCHWSSAPRLIAQATAEDAPSPKTHMFSTTQRVLPIEPVICAVTVISPPPVPELHCILTELFPPEKI